MRFFESQLCYFRWLTWRHAAAWNFIMGTNSLRIELFRLEIIEIWIFETHSIHSIIDWWGRALLNVDANLNFQQSNRINTAVVISTICFRTFTRESSARMLNWKCPNSSHCSTVIQFFPRTSRSLTSVIAFSFSQLALARHAAVSLQDLRRRRRWLHNLIQNNFFHRINSGVIHIICELVFQASVGPWEQQQREWANRWQQKKKQEIKSKKGN